MIKDILVIILIAGILMLLLQLKIDSDNDLTSSQDIIDSSPEVDSFAQVKHSGDYKMLEHDYTIIAKPGYVTDIFMDMFQKPTPWLNSLQNYDRKKMEVINQYFVNLQ